MKQAGAPLLCVYDVNLVNERTLWRMRPRARGGKSAEQLRPAFFDHPAEGCLRKSGSQRGSCGKSMNDVAHRPKAGNRYPVQRPNSFMRYRAHEQRASRRDRIISVEE